MREGVRISYESERGCGYRKEGGLYMMGGQLALPCGRLPMEMTVCPTCNAGIKPTKGWTWINPQALFGIEDSAMHVSSEQGCIKNQVEIKGKECGYVYCSSCYVGSPPERAGLIWIGTAFYEDAAAFAAEAREMGISRRIPAVPNDFEAGKTVVYLGHRHGIQKQCDCDPAERSECEECGGDGWYWVPAIFGAFVPTHIEKVVGEDVTEEEVEKLEKRGIVPVIVRKKEQELDFDGQERDAGGAGADLAGAAG